MSGVDSELTAVSSVMYRLNANEHKQQSDIIMNDHTGNMLIRKQAKDYRL